MDMTRERPEALERIPARQGIARHVQQGQRITIFNTHGKQVIDTWAFSQADIGEYLSMEHSRASLLKLIPGIGDTLVSNRRRPMLTIVEDTTPGVHDTLIAACDTHRYALLGVDGYHDNCTDNLARALGELGMGAPSTPAPLNLFMNVPVRSDGALAFEAPTSEPGQHVVLRAEADLVIVFSACPQDITPVNGMLPTDAHFTIE